VVVGVLAKGKFLVEFPDGRGSTDALLLLEVRQLRPTDEGPVTRVTLEEAKRMEDHTDWEYLRNMTEAEIEQNARTDPDNPPLSFEQLMKGKRVPPEQQQQ